MENQITKHEPQAITDAELIKYLDVMGLSKMLLENEKQAFIQIAKLYQLNPFKREIYAVKYKEGDPMSIITGYEVYLKRAERHSQYEGEEISFNNDKDGNLETCTVKVYRKDRKFPTVKTVWLSEYIQLIDEKVFDKGNMVKTGKKIPTKFWQKTHTMLEKVTIAQAYRKAFPDEMGGMPYTSEEMPETIDTPHTETKEPSTSAPVAAVPLAATPQPVIDNHVHAVNAIKKHNESLATVKEQWDRMDKPTQSHPAVIDEMAANMVAFIKAAANMSTLKSVWATINNIDKSFILMPSLIEVKEAKKIELTPVKA